MRTIISKTVTRFREANISEVTLLGHDQIDEDSCISSLLMCYVLEHFDIKATFKILDRQIPKQTVNVLKELGYDLTDFQQETTGEEEYIFLVDHYQTKHPGKVIGCIDHHPTEKNFDYLVYENGYGSACSKKIYDLMIEEGVPVDKHWIRMVAYALVIDTFDFKSPRGRLEDKVWLEEVVPKYDLDYSKMVDYALNLTDLTQDIPHIAMTSLKEYRFNGHRIKSTYILVREVPHNIEGILRYLQQLVLNEKIAMWVFLTVNVVNNQTTEYRICKETIEEVNHGKLASRAQEIMPIIEQLFNS